MRAAVLALALFAAGCSKKSDDCRNLASAINARKDAGGDAVTLTQGATALRALRIGDATVDALRTRYAGLFEAASSASTDLEKARAANDLGKENVAAAKLSTLTTDEHAVVTELNVYCAK